MGNWAHERVEVDMWTVLMAIRYGMLRQTYAAQDAASLAHRFWEKFPPDIQLQIKRDVLAETFPATNWQYWTWLERTEAQ
jgi:hypothetical protein